MPDSFSEKSYFSENYNKFVFLLYTGYRYLKQHHSLYGLKCTHCYKRFSDNINTFKPVRNQHASRVIQIVMHMKGSSKSVTKFGRPEAMMPVPIVCLLIHS